MAILHKGSDGPSITHTITRSKALCATVTCQHREAGTQESTRSLQQDEAAVRLVMPQTSSACTGPCIQRCQHAGPFLVSHKSDAPTRKAMSKHIHKWRVEGPDTTCKPCTASIKKGKSQAMQVMPLTWYAMSKNAKWFFSSINLLICAHCSGVGSTPVGLWAQAATAHCMFGGGQHSNTATQHRQVSATSNAAH